MIFYFEKIDSKLNKRAFRYWQLRQNEILIKNNQKRNHFQRL